MDMFRHLFHTHSDRFPFFFNAALVFALAARHLVPAREFHARTRRIVLQKLTGGLVNNIKSFIFVLKSRKNKPE